MQVESRPGRTARVILLSAAILRSPCSTMISTCGWLSAAVLKTWLFLVGIVVLRSMMASGHPAKGLDAQRQRGHVEKENVLHVTGEHAGLDGRAYGHDLIGVDALVRLPLEYLRHLLLHHGHPGLATDQYDVVDLGSVQAGVLQRLPCRASRSSRPGRRPASRAGSG